MAAPIRFLSGRQQQQKIGIEGSTDNQKVLEVVGQVGIGTTVFEPSTQLEVRGDVSVSGVLTAGSLNVSGVGGVPASITVETLNITGVSTFGGAVDINAGLDVDGQSDLDELVVAGVATFSAAVDINSTLDVDGDTQLDDLNVAGVSTFSSAVNATDIIKGYKYTAVPYGSTVTLAVTVASKDSTHRYNGTGSGNGYVIDGIQAPFLTLTPGRTYRFTNDNTGSHPLKFYLEADKTTLYETNVNFQDAYTEITVTDQTPIVLHYQCTAHAYMGNAVQTNANVVNTNYPATIRSTLDVSGVSTFTQLDVSTGGIDVDGQTNLDELVVAGVSTFTGNIVADTAEFAGNVTVGGTLFSENKTNIDSVGLVTARTGVRIITGGIDVTAGVSTFSDFVSINDGLNVVGGLTADSLTISGITTGINAAGISSFVRIDVDGQADLDEVVIAGVATFQGAVNFDVNSEINIGTGVTILGNNLHVTGIVSAAQFVGDGSGITNLPGISTLGSSSLTDVNVSGTTTTVQLRISGIGTAEKFFVSTGGFEVDGQSDLDELVVAGVSTFSANTFINADLSVTGNIGASGIITATGIQLVAGSGLDVGAVGVLTALSVDVSTGGIDVDGQATLDEVVVAGVATFSALADVNNRLDVAGGANIDQVNVTGIASFTQLDVSTGGIDVDGQTDLDELIVAGVSTFTGTVKIDGALDIGVAGVDVEGLTNLDELIVAGVSTFTGAVDINAGLDVDGQTDLDELVVAGVSTFTGTVKIDGALDIGVAGVDVDGQTDLDELQVAGVSTFSALIDANARLDVVGGANIDQLNVSGVTTFSGALNADSDLNTNTINITDVISHRGDADTRIRFPAADTFTVETNGSEALRVNSSQNVNFFGSLVNVNATGVSSFVQLDVSTGGLDVDGETQLDELVVAGVSTFTGLIDANGGLNVSGGSGLVANTLGATNLNDGRVVLAAGSGQLSDNANLTFDGSTFNVTGHTELDNVNVSGVSTFSSDISIADKIIHTGDTNTAIRFPAADTFTVETSGSEALRVDSSQRVGIGTDDPGNLNGNADDLVVGNGAGNRGITVFSGTSNQGNLYFADGTDGSSPLRGGITYAHDDNSLKFLTNAVERLRITSAGNVNFLGSLVNVNATGVSSFVQLDVSTGGLDVDGQTDLDELQVAGVSTFSAKAVFNTAYPSIDADNEIQVGTAIQLGKAGVITATSFSGSGANLTGIAATDHVSTFDLVVAGISTFNKQVKILNSGLDIAGVATFSNIATNPATGAVSNIYAHTEGGATSGTLVLSGKQDLRLNTGGFNRWILDGGDLVTHGTTYHNLGAASASGGRVGNGYFQTSVDLIDDGELRLGTGDDFKLYHDGTNSHITNATGDLKVTSNVFGVSGIITATGINVVAGSGLDAGATGIVTAVGAEFNGTSHIKLPAGSTGQRPGSPTAGDLRYNSDDGAFEGYTDSWGAIGGGTPEVDTNVSSTSAVGVGSFATASFRSAEVVAQIVQIDKYQVGKYLMIHDGTTVTVIEQAAVATGDSMIGSFDGAINGSNVELRVTMVSSGIATVTTKISTVTV